MMPERRSRNCGNTAWVIAITPKVLVSKSSRAVVSGVASKAPMAPMPALLTSTSIGPAASSAAAIDSRVGDVEREHAQRTRAAGPRAGVRMVAITFQPCASKWRAVSRP